MADDDERDSFTGIAQGVLGRGLPTARLLMRTGAKFAARTVGFGPKSAHDASREEHAVAAARELVSQLGELKGLAMKFGQMMSYLDASVPPAARDVLAKLQAQSQPMVFETVAEVIERDLGRGPHAVFEEFEQTPFAAASIGQVHRAKLSGRWVAVKVKYPEIEKAIGTDVATIRNLTRAVSVFSTIDLGALVQELSDRVSEECDYRLEAQNQLRLRPWLEELPGTKVPEVIEECSGRSVLTSAYCDGQRFTDFARSAPDDARRHAAEVIYRACFHSIFVHGVYNADPHPGNYLFSPEGDVTLLDFGCIKWFTREFIATWKRLARTILDNDRQSFEDAFCDAGLVRTRKGFDFDEQFATMRYLYRPILSQEPFAFTEEFIQGVHDRLIFKNSNKFKLDLPPDWLFLNRLQFGLFSVLGQLRAPVCVAPLFRDAVESALIPIPT